MKLRTVRWVVQASALVVSNLGLNWTLKTGCVYPFLYCYGCPLASAGCPIGSLQHFVVMRMLPLYLIGMIGVYGLIFGRTFCGWACPFGGFQDLLSRKVKKRGGRAIPQGKLVTLIFVLIFAWVTSDTFFCKFCPSGSLFAAIPAPLFYKDLRLGVFFYVHLLTLGTTVALALLISRFWCRYICPLGTIGIFNKISLLTIRHDTSKCNHCGTCLNACPMGVKETSNIGQSTDCILCGRCIDECATGALQFSRKHI